jgi:hypothetical protein
MKCGPRHLALVHAQVDDLALVAGGLPRPCRARCRTGARCLRGEADVQQLGGDLLAHLAAYSLSCEPLLLEALSHLRVQAADHARSARARRSLSCSSDWRWRGGMAPALVLVVGLLLVLRLVILDRRRSSSARLFLDRLFLGVRVDEAVDDLVDAHLVLLDLVGELEDLGDRRRAGRDRLIMCLQAVLDALGDLDLALARQELDRAHLAHVHAHRVGGAAELGVHRRQRGFGFLLDVLVRYGGRRCPTSAAFRHRAPGRRPGCPCR